MKDTYFDLNGKQIKAKDFNFNVVCDMEDMGVNIMEYEKKTMSFIRGYVAVCLGSDKDAAGREMEQHVIKGGNFDEITGIMMEAVEESDFFRALNKETETEAPTTETQSNEITEA